LRLLNRQGSKSLLRLTIQIAGKRYVAWDDAPINSGHECRNASDFDYAPIDDPLG
jgi:hypothetical protein